MKTTLFRPSALTRIAACFAAALCLGVAPLFAAPSVTVPLDGKLFGHGKSIFANSGTARLDKAPSYSFTFKGTCHGRGKNTVLLALVPNPISFKGLLNSFKRKSGNFLTGTYNNPGGKFPILAIDHEYSRTITTDNGPVTITATILAGVRGGTGSLNGQAYFTITDVSITTPSPVAIGLLEFDNNAELVITATP